jgi:hypothetical protein
MRDPGITIGAKLAENTESPSSEMWAHGETFPWVALALIDQSSMPRLAHGSKNSIQSPLISRMCNGFPSVRGPRSP